MKRSNCFAFTLVELLVVIAIIGILVALLLPSIQASRESARRAQCTSQISQLGLALQEYEAAHEHYPTGTTNPTGPIKNLPVGDHISWIAHILPYIEEQAVYKRLDFSLSAYHEKNDRARQVAIALLICPSSRDEDWPYSNYAGCHHDREAPIDTTNSGVLFLDSRISRDDLKDGSGYTIFVGEKVPDDYDLGWLSGTPGTLRNAGSPLNSISKSVTSGITLPWTYSYATGSTQWQWDNQQLDPVSGELVETPPAGDSGQKASDVAETDPELKPDKNGLLPHSRLGGNTTSPLAVGGFASNHVTGVNFAFGDGSVRFISENVTADVMGRLANRADGQVFDARDLP